MPYGRAARAVRLRKRLGRGSHQRAHLRLGGDLRITAGVTVGAKTLYTVPKRSATEGVGERDVPVSFAGTPLPLDTTSTPVLRGS